ncbi:MAG: hypothetical protein AB7O24_06180 [Kofleriaceae bacterium]
MTGSRLAEIARRIVAAARFVKSLPRLAWQWLVSNAIRCITIGWIGGMVAFSGVTALRIRRQILDENARESQQQLNAPRIVKDSDGPGETVEMLDVDEINNIRDERMRANGLAAAGDEGDPDQAAIDAARKSRATTKAIEGDVAGTSGKITVVTKGGIAGWIKRNKGKKADPETLAWLRGEEAAEGRSAYAGWADRADGSILNYAKETKATRSGAIDADQRAAFAEAGVEVPKAGSATGARAGSAGSAITNASGAPPATAPSTATAGSAAVTEPAGTVVSPTPTTAAPATAAVTATSPSPPTPSTRATASAAPAVANATPAHGFEVISLGRAAVAAIAAGAGSATAPPVAELSREELEQVRDVADPGTIVTIERDHRTVLLLRSDLLYGSGTTELSPTGKLIVRRLAKVLSALPDRAYQILADPDRAMELAGTLAVSGLDPERLALGVKAIDPAIDLLEIELIPVRAHRGDDTVRGSR